MLMILIAAPVGAAGVDGKWVAFDPSKGAELTSKCSRSSPGRLPPDSYWRVPTEQVRLIDLQLDRYIGEMKTRGKFLASHPFGQSLRRYLGIRLNNGELAVYIDVEPAKPEDPKFPPETFGLPMCHGGPNYWGVVYVPRSGEFQDLLFDTGPPPRSNRRIDTDRFAADHAGR